MNENKSRSIVLVGALLPFVIILVTIFVISNISESLSDSSTDGGVITFIVIGFFIVITSGSQMLRYYISRRTKSEDTTTENKKEVEFFCSSCGQKLTLSNDTCPSCGSSTADEKSVL